MRTGSPCLNSVSVCVCFHLKGMLNNNSSVFASNSITKIGLVFGTESNIYLFSCSLGSQD